MRLPVNHAAPLVALVLLSACGGEKAVTPKSTLPQPAANGPAADYPVVIGDPFNVGSVTYTPADRLNFDAVGYAAIGSDGGQGVTAAHKTLPLPSYVEVTSLDTGKTILVRVERRGPMTNDRLIELSPGAAAQLGVAADKAPVRVRRVNPPEPERAVLRAGQRAPDRMETPRPLVAVLLRRIDPQGQALLTGPTPGATPTPAAKPGAALRPTATGKPAPKPRPMPISAPLPVTTPSPVAIPKPVTPPAATPTPKPAVVAKPAPKPAPALRPMPIPAAGPSATATPAAKPSAPTPKPVTPAPKPKPNPAATPVAAPRPVANGRFVIQIGAFSSKANADASARKVGGGVSPNGKLFNVRSGPYATRADADAALAKARRAGYSDARIQSAN